MANDDDSARTLVAHVLSDLTAEAEKLLLTAQALEDQASGVTSAAHPQTLAQAAALVKSAALQMTTVAANVVGTAECLRLVAGFLAIDESEGNSGELPS